MVNVTILHKNNAVKIHLLGHAGNNGESLPDVCSAVTALAYTILVALANTKGVHVKHHDKPGDFLVEAERISHKNDKIVNYYIKMIVLGYLQLQKNFPQNIFVIS